MNYQPSLSTVLPIKRLSENGTSPVNKTVKEILDFAKDNGCYAFYAIDTDYSVDGLTIRLVSSTGSNYNDLYIAGGTYISDDGEEMCKIGMYIISQPGGWKTVLCNSSGDLYVVNNTTGTISNKVVNDVRYYYFSGNRTGYGSYNTIFYSGTFNNIYINGEDVTSSYSFDLLVYNSGNTKLVYTGASLPITNQRNKCITLQNNGGANTKNFYNSAVIYNIKPNGYENYYLLFTIFSDSSFSILTYSRQNSSDQWSLGGTNRYNYKSGEYYSTQYFEENTINGTAYDDTMFMKVYYSPLTIDSSYLPLFTSTEGNEYMTFITNPYPPLPSENIIFAIAGPLSKCTGNVFYPFNNGRYYASISKKTNEWNSKKLEGCNNITTTVINGDWTSIDNNYGYLSSSTTVNVTELGTDLLPIITQILNGEINEYYVFNEPDINFRIIFYRQYNSSSRTYFLMWKQTWPGGSSEIDTGHWTDIRANQLSNYTNIYLFYYFSWNATRTGSGEFLSLVVKQNNKYITNTNISYTGADNYLANIKFYKQYFLEALQEISLSIVDSYDPPTPPTPVIPPELQELLDMINGANFTEKYYMTDNWITSLSNISATDSRIYFDGAFKDYTFVIYTNISSGHNIRYITDVSNNWNRSDFSDNHYVAGKSTYSFTGPVTGTIFALAKTSINITKNSNDSYTFTIDNITPLNKYNFYGTIYYTFRVKYNPNNVNWESWSASYTDLDFTYQNSLTYTGTLENCLKVIAMNFRNVNIYVDDVLWSSAVS